MPTPRKQTRQPRDTITVINDGGLCYFTDLSRRTGYL